VKRPTIDDVRASLWVPPAVAGAVAFGVALALVGVRTGDAGWLGQVAWPGDRTSASNTLQIIAASVITATTVAFSLVVIALQLASQQFSPRLLRDFARDWVVQAVLSVLFATFVFSLTTLRSLDDSEPLPALSVLIAFGMGLASMAALLAVIAHIIRALRVDTMMVAVHGETLTILSRFYSPYDRPPVRPGPDLPGPRGGQCITASRSGFVLSLDLQALVDAAERAGAFVRIGVRPGDHVTLGTPLGSWWPCDERATSPVEGVRAAVRMGYERTRDQDAALGFRQLADIAVKALSPGINDPGTAVHAVGYLTDLLVRLCGCSLGPGVHADAGGTPRVVVPDRDLRFYLDLSCALVRRFGAAEPMVLVALLSMLRDVAVATRDDEQCDEVRRQVDLVLATTSGSLVEEDAAGVRDAARRVHLALGGRVEDAFTDRSGETHSA
jgi:uncharacterized membrane protein